MKRLLALIRSDLQLQIRYGFYTVYSIVTVIYLLVLWQIPVQAKEFIVPFIIYSDPALLGFYFIGGLILLEKGENTLECLVSTPVTIKEYLSSKQVSLTILALLASLIIVLCTYNKNVNYFLLLIGIALTSFFFVCVGFIAVAKFKNLSEYLITAIIYMLIFNLPLLNFFDLINSKLLYIFPTQASLIIIKSAFKYPETWKIYYGIFYLLGWVFIVYKLAYKSFYRFIILKERG